MQEPTWMDRLPTALETYCKVVSKQHPKLFSREGEINTLESEAHEIRQYLIANFTFYETRYIVAYLGNLML